MGGIFGSDGRFFGLVIEGISFIVVIDGLVGFRFVFVIVVVVGLVGLIVVLLCIDIIGKGLVCFGFECC